MKEILEYYLAIGSCTGVVASFEDDMNTPIIRKPGWHWLVVVRSMPRTRCQPPVLAEVRRQVHNGHHIVLHWCLKSPVTM
jgi:hypothetical protein